MNQCVPSWDFDEPPKADRLALHSNPTLDEMAELIWENGQLVMHELRPPRVVAKGKQTTTEHSWDKPRESGTLESIVNQATQFTPPSQSSPFRDGDDLGSRFDNHRNHHCAIVPTSSNTMAMDALVEEGFVRKRARVGMTGEEGSMNNYHSVMESNTNANTLDDSVSHSRTQGEVGGEDDHKKGNNEKSTVSTKRNRAAAIHNQSEGKRRDKINQRMKTLQKLVPNSSKTDKASILDEVIDYLKQLQAQVQMMSRMSMPQMMMPMAMSQQFQMAMMAQMSMGTVMGMGMGMDMNTVGQPNISGIPLVFNPAAAFMPISSWDGTSDHVPSSVTTLPDPMANFLACQSQPMNIDAYSRMAALYQQLHRQQVSNPRPET